MKDQKKLLLPLVFIAFILLLTQLTIMVYLTYSESKSCGLYNKDFFSEKCMKIYEYSLKKQNDN